MAPRFAKLTAAKSPVGIQPIPAVYPPNVYWNLGLSTGTVAITIGVLYETPLDTLTDTTLVEMICEVTTVGGAGALLRAGIYQDRGDGLGAGELFDDYGSIASDDATGVHTWSPNTLVPAGRTWLAIVGFISSTTLRSATVPSFRLPQTVALSGVQHLFSFQSGVTVSLPTRFTATPSGASVAPCLAVKLAPA